MLNQIILSLAPAGLAFVLSLLITPLVINLAWKWGLIDNPQTHKHAKVIHERPTPRSGGIAIFASFLITILVFLPLDEKVIGILAGSLVIIVMGTIDDAILASGKKDFHPLLRLAIQFASAAIPVFVGGIGIFFTTRPFGGIVNLAGYPLLPQILALFWIVFLMNILNLGAKGVDGQLTGVTAIAAVIIGLLSLRFSADLTEWPVIILAAATFGAYFGFLPYHIHPQKIMPAFGGSNLAGYLLAILSILTTAKVGTLLVVLAVPLIDTGFVLVRRIASGKLPFWGDRGHLHHRLLDLGWSKSQVALFYWGITLVLGLLALNLKAETKLYTIVGITALVGSVILWSTYRSKFSK